MSRQLQPHFLVSNLFSSAFPKAINGKTLSNITVVPTSCVLQRPIKYLCVEPEMVRQYLLSLGSSAGFASAYLDMCAAFAGGAYAREPRTSSSTTPTTLQEWAMSVLLPAVKNLDSSRNHVNFT